MMMETILLAVALAMDCLSVSMAAGMTARRLVMGPMLGMTLAFGVFQGGMTLLGYVGTNLMHGWIESVDHWIAFALLTYLGVNMISSLWRKDDEETMGLLKWSNIPFLALATSIDALAVGISLACAGCENIGMRSGVIGVTSSLFTIVGLSTGILAGRKLQLPLEPIGGLVLIGIGVRVLVEHLFE